MVESDEAKVKNELLKERSEVAWEGLKKANPNMTFTNRDKRLYEIGCEDGARIGIKIQKDMDNIIKSRIVDDLNNKS